MRDAQKTVFVGSRSLPDLDKTVANVNNNNPPLLKEKSVDKLSKFSIVGSLPTRPEIHGVEGRSSESVWGFTARFWRLFIHRSAVVPPPASLTLSKSSSSSAASPVPRIRCRQQRDGPWKAGAKPEERSTVWWPEDSRLLWEPLTAKCSISRVENVNKCLVFNPPTSANVLRVPPC